MEHQILTAREACDYLRVSMFTLSKIEKANLLTPYRTPGGHRRYSRQMLDEYLESTRGQPKASGESRPVLVVSKKTG